MIKMLGMLIDSDGWDIAAAVLDPKFVNTPKAEVLDLYYLVLNDQLVIRIGNQKNIILKNEFYNEDEFWKEFEQINPEEDPAIEFFEIRRRAQP